MTLEDLPSYSGQEEVRSISDVTINGNKRVVCLRHLFPPEERLFGKYQGDCAKCPINPSRNFNCSGYIPEIVTISSVELKVVGSGSTSVEIEQWPLVSPPDPGLVRLHREALMRKGEKYVFDSPKHRQVRALYQGKRTCFSTNAD